MSKISLKSMILIFSLLIPLHILARPKHVTGNDDEKALIKSMQGCFEVTSAFGETGLLDEKYPITSRDFFSKNYEYIALDGEGEDLVELQHIVLTPFGPKKYQRDQWERGPRKIISYMKPNRYEQNPYPTKGNHWSLTVRGIDESPSYSCAAPLSPIREDFAFWDCSNFSPLPRRESIQRNDYNFFGRKNFIVFSEVGWVYKQTNRKVQYVEGQADVSKTIAWEDGYVSYKKTDEQFCAEAKDWWKTQSASWSKVRDVWGMIFNKYYAVVFKDLSDGKPLSDEVVDLVSKTQDELKNLGETGNSEEIYKTMQSDIIKTIGKYVKDVNEEGQDK